MANNIVTPNATLSFPVLFAPRPRSEGAKPVYSCSLLFSPEAQKSPEYKAMQTACISAAKAKFGADVKLNSLTFPFRDASEKDYKGYEDGWIYISPWSEQRPGVVDAQVQDVIDPSLVYAGQIVRASIAPFAWKNSGKMGVSFGLNHIQLVKEGTRIDGRIAANKAFKPIEDSESPF
jgi:ssDNA-binding protein